MMTPISDFPAVMPRRPLHDEEPQGYLESDRDLVLNNLEACVWFLEHAEQLRQQRDDLLREVFSFGLLSQRTTKARMETYLQLTAEGYSHREALDAANQIIHVG